MNFDFEAFLTLATLFCGVVTLVHWVFSRLKKRSQKEGVLVEYARSFFPVLLVVLLIRSFLVQPYRVPTGSLEPTILPGDFILVNQYAYGLRAPLSHTQFFSIGEPKTGQIALFRWPVNPSITFVKRVIGVPGDHISYINKVLYINGKEEKQRYIGESAELTDSGEPMYPVKEYEENLNGVKHRIIVHPEDQAQDFYDLVVPPGHYFMMGDNRDDSDDSRSWGFVPEFNLIGRAMFVLISWDSHASLKDKIRWNRIGAGL